MGRRLSVVRVELSVLDRSIDAGRTAVHEEEDHPLRFGAKCGCLTDNGLSAACNRSERRGIRSRMRRAQGRTAGHRLLRFVKEFLYEIHARLVQVDEFV